MIRVLIVDDSAFMRKALTMMLSDDPEVEVIDTARDGLEAIEKVHRLQPDLVTLDIEMPRMDGLTALRRIMKEAPVPVIMLSSLTQEGARVTLDALDAGAVDFIPKHTSFVSLEITRIRDTLLEKVKTLARKRSAGRPVPPVRETAPRRPMTFYRSRLIAVGISTGGPAALQTLIPRLNEALPVPVAIVQHMPAHFTKTLAQRLDRMSPLHVVEAEEGMLVRPGMVLLAPGGRHLTFRPAGHDVVVSTPTHPETLHRPSVDVMFTSAAAAFGGRVLGVVMTGMGHDGCEGAREVRRRGGKIIAQDAASSVVYGMPRAVVEADLADSVLSLNDIAPALERAVMPPGSHPNAPPGIHSVRAPSSRSIP